jgi:hypothetical protein
MMSPSANRDAEPPGEFKIVSRAVNPVWSTASTPTNNYVGSYFSGVLFHTGSPFAKTGGIVSLKSPLK